MAEKVPSEPKEERQRRVAAEIQAQRRLDAMKDVTDVEVESEQPWLQPGVIDSPVFQPSVPTEPAPETPPTATMGAAFANPKPLKEKPKNGKKAENGKVEAEKEESFDPHSVATAQTLEDQKKTQEMRAHLAEVGVIPTEAVRPPDIDISRADVPQYKSHPEVQAELDKLNQKVDTRTEAEKLAEAEEGLRVVSEMFGAQPKHEQTIETSEPVAIPPELQAVIRGEVSPQLLKKYTGLTNPKRKKYFIENLVEAQKKDAEKENERRDENKKSAKPRTQKSKQKPESDLIDKNIAAARKAGKTTEEQAKDEIRHMAAEATADIGIPASTEPDGKIEPTLDVDSISSEDVPSKPEGTRSEWYAKLKETVGRVVEGGKENFIRSKEYLDNRAKEIDRAAEMSGLEKWTRIIGEKYEKLSLIHKLGIGVGLGVTTAVGAAFSLPVALAGLTGLVLQRGAGAASMFLSLEKKLQEKKIGESFQFIGMKERAALDAMLYTAVMGTAINQGLEYAREHGVVERISAMFGHHTAEPIPKASVHTPVAQAPRVAVPNAPAAPEIHPPAAPVEVPKAPEAPLASHAEVIAPEVHEPAASVETPKAPEMPEVAAPEVHEPATVAPEVAKLEADEGIVITEIQVPEPEPTEPFVAPTETAETPATPAEDPAAPVSPQTPEVQPLPTETIVSPDTTVKTVDITNAPEFVSQSPIETPPVSIPEEQPLPTETIVSPDTTVTPVDITNAPEFVSQPEVEAPAAPLEAPASAPAPVEGAVNLPNKFGLTIPANETHLYEGAGGKETFIFGGTAQEKARIMLEFFKEHPTKIIYSGDETGTRRIPWRFIQGQLVRGEPVQEGWLFARSLMKAPSPDDFAKGIK
ncbi:MAG: hypothetical protein PHD04_02540 [Candidatus Pacebacteria bacterium]|nr:hypothetical protein [Candidatus Paceibacterota bacterium]